LSLFRCSERWKCFWILDYESSGTEATMFLWNNNKLKNFTLTHIHVMPPWLLVDHVVSWHCFIYFTTGESKEGIVSNYIE
jgi:hypothetical protein